MVGKGRRWAWEGEGVLPKWQGRGDGEICVEGSGVSHIEIAGYTPTPWISYPDPRDIQSTRHDRGGRPSLP